MNQSQLFLNISRLYRNTQKYYDKVLAPYDIGAGQYIFLILINENEGISNQSLTELGGFDKGTTAKSLQKLLEQGYIEFKNDEKDKRMKHYYTSEKANNMMNDIYEARNNCRKQLSGDVDLLEFEDYLETVTHNSDLLNQESLYKDIQVAGIQKLTLLDYPSHIACTLFTGGCNFKCPFCHNKELVFLPENFESIDIADLFDFLNKRKGLLDAVCISGGEPLLQSGLIPFIQEIKNLGYKIKLDTNGYYPEKLKDIIESGLIDYVAMDIKNSKEKYAMTIGLNDFNFDLSRIEESVKIIMNSSIDYEFRTTIVKELHDQEDIKNIGQWLKGCKHYYLQQYKDSENVIQKGFSALDAVKMEELKNIASQYIDHTSIRGIKEDD